MAAPRHSDDAASDARSVRQSVSVCPVCGGTTFKSLFVVNDIDVKRCAQCDLVLQSPQPSDRELDEIYGSNYFIGSSDNDTAMRAQFAIVKREGARLQLDEIEAYLSKDGRDPSGLRLLEIGPGHGHMLGAARDRGFQVQGLEYSADAAARANKSLGAEVVRVGMLDRATIPDASVDVCVLSDVIEHVRDPRAFVGEIARVLKDGGVLFMATPSMTSWSARLLGRHWMEFKPEHLFYFTPATVARLLGAAGFSDVTITPGCKMLTPEYVIGHFEKFPIPVLTPLLKASRALTPDALRSRPFKITASGINVLARVPSRH